MKELNLYLSLENEDTVIFNNLDISKMTEPFYIDREVYQPEDVQVFEKKKSEILEYESEDYMKLLAKETEPFVVTDSESRSMCGKFQNMPENSGMYFAFINTGSALKVVPISKWYRFVQKNQTNEAVDTEGLEKNLANVEYEEDDSESVHEIDFDENFDDDEEEEAKVVMEKEKKLSTSGKKLDGLVKDLEDMPEREEEQTKENEKRAVKEETTVDEAAKKRKTKAPLTTEDVKKVIGNKKITVKELLQKLNQQFKLEENEKQFIKAFLKEHCDAVVDKVTGETMIVLKK